jgi:hypothetical protein
LAGRHAPRVALRVHLLDGVAAVGEADGLAVLHGDLNVVASVAGAVLGVVAAAGRAELLQPLLLVAVRAAAVVRAGLVNTTELALQPAPLAAQRGGRCGLGR